MTAPFADASHSVSPRAPLPPMYRPPHSGESAGEAISGASQRLRALAALSGSLTDALVPEEAANLVEQQALLALGATGAVVMTLGHFPPTAPTCDLPVATLEVVHAVGLAAEVKALLDQLPLEAPVPLAEVARVGEPLFLRSEHDLQRYPEWGAAMIRAGSCAAAIVPVWANGELRGVLGLSWAAPRSFDEDGRAFVLTLGVMCAQAIMRAHLRAAELLAREAAERANASKTQFLATISHELRTPMNAVIGYTELLADEIAGPVSALQKDHLRRVRSSGKHLLGLIEELLGYARLEAGEETVRAQPIALAGLVEQSLELVRPLAEKKGLRIGAVVSEETVELHTDALKVRQILVNLLANAVKFTDAGDVTLTAHVEGRDSDARVCFEVTDLGRGIALADQEHIFDAFWQADPALTRTHGGTGLGLQVARRLATMLGGGLSLSRSAPGEGSTFAVTLPVRFPGA